VLHPLLGIAVETKRLGVLPDRFAASNDRHDMIDLQILCGTASRTFSAEPVSAVTPRKAVRRLVDLPVATNSVGSWHASLVGSQATGFGAEPSVLLIRANPEGLPALFALDETACLLPALKKPGGSTGSLASFGAKSDFAPAFFRSSDKCRPALESAATNFADQCNLWHRLASSDNSGELRETQFPHEVAFAAYANSLQSANPEPSHACSGRKTVRGMEGATTRGCGNNNPPTSARRHSNGEDIVSSARIMGTKVQNDGHKQAVNEAQDSGYEMLNISPSDVFTAAEYPIRQIAVAVSISGLEQLQNA
jgi:hypothetical protein